jgi:predicted nucleotidyltransferase
MPQPPQSQRSVPKPVQELREMLQRLFPDIRERYSVDSVSLFGSYVRHQERSDSDLDVLVTFKETPGLLKFVELENYLSDALGVRVDLVMRESLKPRIGQRILREAVPV